MSPTQPLFKSAEVIAIVFNKQGETPASHYWFQGVYTRGLYLRCLQMSEKDVRFQ